MTAKGVPRGGGAARLEDDNGIRSHHGRQRRLVIMLNGIAGIRRLGRGYTARAVVFVGAVLLITAAYAAVTLA